MIHSFPAPRMRRPVLLTLGAVTLVLLFAAFTPGTARAECLSSTFESRLYNDGPFPDAPAGAPDIRYVDGQLDFDCLLSVDPLLDAPLGTNQYLLISLSPDRTTGSPSVDILIEPGFPPAVLDGAGNIVAELDSYGDDGFIAYVDDLGIPTGINLGIGLVGVYDPDPNVDGDEVFDLAPNTFPLYGLPINYEEPPPPPPPPPPQPPPPPPAAPAAPAAKQVTGCVVPKLKGLTVKKAKAALTKAGCKYKLKGKGRVRSFSPKAGTRTAATVQVKCKKRRKKKRSHRAAILRDAQAAALRLR